MDYAANKTEIIDTVKKVKSEVDIDYKDILGYINVDKVGTKGN